MIAKYQISACAVSKIPPSPRFMSRVFQGLGTHITKGFHIVPQARPPSSATQKQPTDSINETRDQPATSHSRRRSTGSQLYTPSPPVPRRNHRSRLRLVPILRVGPRLTLRPRLMLLYRNVVTSLRPTMISAGSFVTCPPG